MNRSDDSQGQLKSTVEENRFMLQTIIKDTGIGIENDRIGHLFKAFGELRQKQNMKYVKDSSLGVGLSCSKKIIEAMGGQITFIKNEPQNTQVMFTIPVSIIEEDTDFVSASQFSDFRISQKLGYGDDYVTQKFISQFNERLVRKEKRKVPGRRKLIDFNKLSQNNYTLEADYDMEDEIIGVDFDEDQIMSLSCEE